MSMGAEAGGHQRPVIAQGSESRSQEKGIIQADSAAVFKTQPLLTMGSLEGSVGANRTRDWNTKNLGQRLAVDTMCAAAAGGLVAPVVSMIDKWVNETKRRDIERKEPLTLFHRAIMENASGKRPLMASIKASLSTLSLRPHIYLTSKPFALIVMVYGGTYWSANLLDTFKSTTQSSPASKTSSGPAKFVATSAANLSLTMVKDSQYTKMFGTVSARRVPPATYALFALRDAMTVFASFNLPPMIAPNLPLGEAAEKYISRASTAQFLAPAAIQFLSTPFHLYGLDMYNRNGGTPVWDRLQKVRVDWLKSSLARICRIVPAFGFGGVVNNSLRLKLQKQLE